MDNLPDKRLISHFYSPRNIFGYLLFFSCCFSNSRTSSMDVKAIGHIESVFRHKNGTPRQSGVCPEAVAKLTISKDIFNNPEHSLEGLEEYSHVW